MPKINVRLTGQKKNEQKSEKIERQDENGRETGEEDNKRAKP